MLIGQLGVAAEEALSRLRGHSLFAGRHLNEVATDVVERRLALAAGPGPPCRQAV